MLKYILKLRNCCAYMPHVCLRLSWTDTNLFLQLFFIPLLRKLAADILLSSFRDTNEICRCSFGTEYCQWQVTYPAISWLLGWPSVHIIMQTSFMYHGNVKQRTRSAAVGISYLVNKVGHQRAQFQGAPFIFETISSYDQWTRKKYWAGNSKKTYRIYLQNLLSSRFLGQQ